MIKLIILASILFVCVLVSFLTLFACLAMFKVSKSILDTIGRQYDSDIGIELTEQVLNTLKNQTGENQWQI